MIDKSHELYNVVINQFDRCARAYKAMSNAFSLPDIALKGFAALFENESRERCEYYNKVRCHLLKDSRLPMPSELPAPNLYQENATLKMIIDDAVKMEMQTVNMITNAIKAVQNDDFPEAQWMSYLLKKARYEHLELKRIQTEIHEGINTKTLDQFALSDKLYAQYAPELK